MGHSLPPISSLLSSVDLSIPQIQALLARAAELVSHNQQADKKLPSLRGRTLVNLFFENSTRTRTSFEIAGKRLGMDVINISPSGSAVSKGETLTDTLRTLDAMQLDALVIRHDESGAAALAQAFVKAKVINAGDGLHQHPTQALADALVLQGLGKPWNSLKVAICGDIAHSRVARSNADILSRLGVEVRFCGPATLMPLYAESLGAKVFYRMDDALDGVDAVMMLRLQKERASGRFVASAREYFATYALTRARLERAKPGAIVMHPGPMNRGLEIDPELADDAAVSRILNQVEAGVAVRMALLEMMLGDTP